MSTIREVRKYVALIEAEELGVPFEMNPSSAVRNVRRMGADGVWKVLEPVSPLTYDGITDWRLGQPVLYAVLPDGLRIWPSPSEQVTLEIEVFVHG